MSTRSAAASGRTLSRSWPGRSGSTRRASTGASWTPPRREDSSPLPITSLDHLVLTVRDGAATRRFYVDGLGMRWTELEGRHALHFGSQKINLHYAGREFEPK